MMPCGSTTCRRLAQVAVNHFATLMRGLFDTGGRTRRSQSRRRTEGGYGEGGYGTPTVVGTRR